MVIIRALSVDKTELSRHVVVVRLAIRVVVDPKYSNLSLPTASCTLFVSDFSGRNEETRWP